MHLGIVSFVSRVSPIDSSDKKIAIDVGVISIDTISATDISKKITTYKAIAGKTRNTRSCYAYIFAVEIEILITCPESRLAVVAIYQLITDDILRFSPVIAVSQR